VTDELDAGPILLQARTPILEDETYGELRLRLSELGALALVEALALIDVGAATETAQDEARASYAPKVTREMTRVDWDRPAVEVARVVRAFDPRPGAYTTRRGAPDTGRPPGRVVAVDGDGMVVACSAGAVRVGGVQPAGKRRLAPAEWARGRGVAVGDQLGT
jgi:methionyl-tRNA formyltransferase